MNEATVYQNASKKIERIVRALPSFDWINIRKKKIDGFQGDVSTDDDDAGRRLGRAEWDERVAPGGRRFVQRDDDRKQDEPLRDRFARER